MNAALIRIPTRRQARDGVGAPRFDGAGIEGAAATFQKTAVVGDGVVGRGRIVPSDGAACSHSGGSGNVIGRTAIHEDLGCWRGRRGGPGHEKAHRKAEKQHVPAHGVVTPVKVDKAIIHRDRLNAEGFSRVGRNVPYRQVR